MRAGRLLRPLEGLWGALDRARTCALGACGVAFCRALVMPRASRVAFAGAALGVSALLLASTVPLWMLVLGPLLWGVPHVLADVRYLVVRPGYHRRALFMVVLSVGLAASFVLGLRGGLLAVAGTVAVARGSLARKVVALGVVGGLYALAELSGWVADAVLVHAHNLVGVGLWWAWRRRGPGAWAHYLPLCVFAVGSALILLGAHEPLFAAAGAHEAPWTKLDFGELEWAFAPTLEGPIASRLVVLFAFQQAMHYVVWLRLVPDEARPQPTPRSFRMSWRALVRELGPWVLLAAAGGALVFWGWALESPAGARHAYLSVSFFHVYLELVAVGVFWVEGRFARRARGEPLVQST
ncbi:MAG: hypothetical protein HY908_22400 [Myxococcales bacterium]|nr:hypothetical protein [Myxococcales bacterium]